MNEVGHKLGELERVLRGIGRVAVAVSGGVDSLTLAVFAHRTLREHVQMFHAVSPAVPQEATARVQALADSEGWTLTMIDAGEFDDADYRSNPVNRCFYCKTNLYGAFAPRTTAQIVSGTNLDDLGEYRPGLAAAKNYGVRHPFVEAGIDKNSVRAIARHLDLGGGGRTARRTLPVEPDRNRHRNRPRHAQAGARSRTPGVAGTDAAHGALSGAGKGCGG